MTSRLWISSIFMVISVLIVFAKEAGAATFDESCSITGSGSACIFSFLTIPFIHPAMMTRYGCGAVRAQA